MRLPPGIALRDATPDDRALLLALYASTRAEELAAVPWSAAERAAFLEQQFTAQDTTYRARYPQGRFLVIEEDGRPIGRFYRARLADEIRVVEITLDPAHRGRGIGTALIAATLAEAAEAGIAVRLYVEGWNRAHALYSRLGFRDIDEHGIYRLMEWRPAPVS